MENGIHVAQGIFNQIFIKFEDLILVSIKREVIGYSGVFEISDRNDLFPKLTEEQKGKCLFYLQKEFQNFKKDKGEVLVVITKESENSYELVKRVKKHLKIFVQSPEKGVLVSYTDQRSVRGKKYFCHVTENKHKKMKELEIFEKVESAINACVDMGYVLYGKWEKGDFVFSFHNKDRRRMSFGIEKGKYCLQIEEEECLLEEVTIEEIRRNMVHMLEQIKKKERLQNLFEKEETIPRSFRDFFGDLYRYNNSYFIRMIWKELRKDYSYEELEKETFLKSKQKEPFQRKLSKDMWIGKFMECYIAYEYGTDKVFVSSDKEEVLEKMAASYKEQWRKEMEQIEKDLV